MGRGEPGSAGVRGRSVWNLPERAKLQCLGIPIFGVDSRVIDPDTLLPVPQGQTGEIVTHGPMVFKGYWGHPAATKDAFVEVDGHTFFRTGDLGRMDDEGYFFMTDRLKRMINASGYKIWPAEVEMLLYKHPAVQEWLAKHPRFVMHFTPTSASWLNMVERFFRDITVNRLRRGVFTSMPELVAAIDEYVAHHNTKPKPFIWTKSAADILHKVIRANARLSAKKNETLN